MLTTPKQPRTVYTNNQVAIGVDYIFDYVVLTDSGWVPFTVLPKPVVEEIQKRMDRNTIFPSEVHNYVQQCLDDPNHARAATA